jgi:hypothetical protein
MASTNGRTTHFRRLCARVVDLASTGARLAPAVSAVATRPVERFVAFIIVIVIGITLVTLQRVPRRGTDDEPAKPRRLKTTVSVGRVRSDRDPE